jgi:hypothetical protein
MPEMKHLRSCLSWGLAAAAILLSPILLIFSVPVAIGIGLDIFHDGEAPLVLALCGPVAFVILRRMVPRVSLRQLPTARRVTPRNRSAGAPARPI